jgi:hypothetical protein
MASGTHLLFHLKEHIRFNELLFAYSLQNFTTYVIAYYFSLTVVDMVFLCPIIVGYFPHGRQPLPR